MSSKRLLLVLSAACVSLLAGMAPCVAQPGVPGVASPVNVPARPQVTPNAIIGQADAVVLGTVTEVAMPNDPPAGAAPPFTPGAMLSKAGWGLNIARVTLHVDKPLLGKPAAGDTITLSFQCFPVYERVGDQTVFKHWSPDMQVKQQAIFALRRDQAGYTPVLGDASIQPAADVAKWEAAIAAMPVQVGMPQIAGALLFGKPVKMTVVVKNQSEQPLQLATFGFSGHYISKKLDNAVQIFPTTAPDGAPADTLPTFGALITLPPKSDKTFTFYVNANPPLAWAMFDADSYLLTPVAFRAVVSVRREEAGRTNFETYASPLTYCYAGYQPPKFE